MSFRARRAGIVALWCSAAVLVLLVAAWAIDTATHSGAVMRNVELGSRTVGGFSQSDLSMVVSALATDNDGRVVVVETPGGSLETTADTIGLQIDLEATEQAALDQGRDAAFPARPFLWFGALFADQRVRPVYRVDEVALMNAVDQLADANRVAPKEPAIMLADDQLVPTPGEDGHALTMATLADELVRAAGEAHDETSPIAVRVEPEPVPPRYADSEAQQVAREANELAARELTVRVGGTSTVVPSSTLRTWMRAVPSPDGEHLVVGVDRSPVTADVTAAVGPVGQPPVELSWNVLPDGSVTYTPGSNGTGCCAEDSSTRVVAALRSGQPSVDLDLTVATPQHDAAWAEQMNIRQPIASFTTPHACCESRVRNIQRMADLVRGVVIPPGETFSLNGHVGQRTTAKGFVEAGVIYNARFTSDVGGGVSQFATTMFNAAFFGGLDFVEYQAHTIYISRYPYGREATLSYPSPDLAVTNSTPFGILIWPTYTGSSITVTLYSSPWVSGEQTGQARQSAGPCTRVTTERTRTWLIDGRQEVDTVSALYQPGEGVHC
jgi:vancomycin resistance protein YoaR